MVGTPKGTGPLAVAAAQPTESSVVKEVVREQFHHYQVEAVHFTALSADEITRYGEIEVLNTSAYDLATHTPLLFGPLDRRLGTGSKQTICATCGQRLEDCVGHFGHVRLVLPVFHAGYLRHTHQVLQCVCKACGRALLRPEESERLLARLRRPTTDDLKRAALHKRMVAMCKKVRHCPHCSAYNAQLRKGAGVPLLLRHTLGPSKSTPEEVSSAFEESFHDAKSNNRELQHLVDKASEDVSPLAAYHLLRQMTPLDRELLGVVQPERMLMTSVPVPPACIRPTVSMGDKGVREDDLTLATSDIVEANNSLRSQLARGSQPKAVLEAWEYLQEKCAVYINSEVSGLNLPKGRPIRSICTRLKGKEGRFRGNLSGKRVDFSGRTVISPDPNVSVEEVVVPEWVAKRMTFPEKVCEANLARLQDAVRRGPEDHPGACFIRSEDGRGKYLGALRKNFRRQIAESLRCGDTVERHMRDGDIVLFNRQPSLHRLSIMAHKAKVMPGRTFRFNECVCAPYNADFDGDEMNLHLPQTEEARAEALQLMGVRDGLVTPKSGEVAICATQDFLTGAFLLTQRDVFLSRDKFCQLCCSTTDGLEPIDLPPPAILKPCELWTGKQAIGVMLRPSRKCKVLVNIELPEKNYSKEGESMCPNDGWVLFRNSELISGNLGKKVLGGAKNGLFFRLIRDNGAQAAVGCMSRLAKLTSRWLMNRGFTIGIDDVNAEYARRSGTKSTAHGSTEAVAAVRGSVTEGKRRITQEKYAVVQERIREYNAGTLQLKPGCNAEQTLEALVNGELGKIRDLVGGMCEERLYFTNKPRIMAQCGSKGSAINLCQMMACVGQQNVGGQRIKDGFVNRTLPHFTKGSKEPKARGFVENSFYSGLEPPEFFFHTMGGREGLVDTAVKTAETGYMQRRLMKALEDLALKYDLTVRTSAGEVVQFAFGDDGLNPARMEGSSSRPLDFDYVMKHVLHVLRPPKLRKCGLGPAQAPKQEHAAKRRRTAGSAAGDEEVQESKGWSGGMSGAASVGGAGGSAAAWSTAAESETLPLPALGECTQALGRRADAAKAVPIQRGAAEARDERFCSRPLLPIELRQLAGPCAERFCAWVRRTHGSAELDVSHMQDDLTRYITGLADEVAVKRQQLCLEPGETVESAAVARAAASLGEALALVDLGCPTQWQLEAFVNRCAVKYVQAMLMPGEAVGAVAAQSIGEPATQMTLKTFHFAGVASMNVTLGVPRIKEIINAAKTISTPIITCCLSDPYSEAAARIVKGRIERTTLGDVCLYFKEVYEPTQGCFISVKVDLATIQKLQLELTVHGIKEALLDHRNLAGIRLTPQDVEVVRDGKLRVRPPQRQQSVGGGKMLFFSLQALKGALPHAVVKGLRSTKRAVINKDDKGPKVRYSILVEGYGMQEVMSTPGIQASRTTSNHVIEVERVLGIEAARRTIMQEIAMTMGSHGISVDARHIQMLGDCMTYRGQVLGINRYGISRMRTSALMLASFERTTDLVFDAAVHQKSDPVKGVSECIILGSTINLGTGLFKILYDFGGRQPRAAACTAPGAGPGDAVQMAHRRPLLRDWRKPGQEPWPSGLKP